MPVRNSSGGRPFQSGCHMALCPAAQRLGLTGPPVSSAVIQSQCSTKPAQAGRRRSSCRRMCKYLLQNHSAE